MMSRFEKLVNSWKKDGELYIPSEAIAVIEDTAIKEKNIQLLLTLHVLIEIQKINVLLKQQN